MATACTRVRLSDGAGGKDDGLEETEKELHDGGLGVSGGPVLFTESVRFLIPRNRQPPPENDSFL
jgi:hypothetical protein